MTKRTPETTCTQSALSGDHLPSYVGPKTQSACPAAASDMDSPAANTRHKKALSGGAKPAKMAPLGDMTSELNAGGSVPQSIAKAGLAKAGLAQAGLGGGAKPAAKRKPTAVRPRPPPPLQSQHADDTRAGLRAGAGWLGRPWQPAAEAAVQPGAPGRRYREAQGDGG